MKRLTFVFVLVLLASSCGSKQNPNQVSSSGDLAPASPSATTTRTTSDQTGSAVGEPSVHKMLIRSGSISLESPNHPETLRQITGIVQRAGGYVSNESSRILENESIESEMTVRIPAERFDSVVDMIKRTGTSVTSENISVEDATKQYYDQESHLNAKKLELAQLEELLRSAKTVQEIIAVRHEIVDVSQSVDELEGSTKLIESEVNYSTLRIELTSKGGNGVIARIGAAFNHGFTGFVDVLTGVITFLIAGIPAFLVILGFVYVIILLVRRGTKKQQATDQLKK